MKNNSVKVLIFVLAVLLISLYYLFVYEPKYSGSVRFSGSENPEIYVHRGGGYFGPDNSLRASLTSIDEGFPGVDVDIQMTKDNKLVVFHDLSVDRLTDATGKVADIDLEDLKKLDLGLKFSTTTIGHYVVDFDTYVKEITKKNGKLSAELKVTGVRDTGAEKEAVEIIKKYNAYDKVILSTFNPFVLWRIKNIDPRIQTMYIFMDTNWNEDLIKEIKKEDFVTYPWILRQEWFRTFVRKVVKPDYLSVNIEVNEAIIKKLIDLEYPVFIWTPKTKEDIEKAIDYKPFGIYTDNKYIAKEMLK